MLTRVGGEQVQRLTPQALAAVLGGDEQAELSTVVQRVKVDEINGSGWQAALVQGNHQPQLALRVDIARVLFQITPQCLS